MAERWKPSGPTHVPITQVHAFLGLIIKEHTPYKEYVLEGDETIIDYLKRELGYVSHAKTEDEKSEEEQYVDAAPGIEQPFDESPENLDHNQDKIEND